MKPTTTILIGAPLSGDEAHVLQALHTNLEGTESLILANFNTPKRQIDFVVITPSYAALLELKNFPRPIFGEQNGIWTYENFAGSRIRYAGENPWQQTKEEKFALSDEMLKYQKRRPDIPLHTGRGYFTQFAAFVCIYPEIHAQSHVTSGDHKVTVASYKNIVDTIKSDSISSTWNLTHWRRFAEEQLSLTEATLGEATNPLINAASGRIADYRYKLQTAIGTALPALLSSRENIDYGSELVNSMVERKNFLILGPSGSAKTFHLHHLALAISVKGEELPLLLEARKYRGADFWTLVRHATAAFLRGDPKQLLDDMTVCGLRPVLMVDALNECSTSNLPDLLLGIQTFSLKFDARVVLTSQTEVELPGDIRALVKRVPLPDALQKRSIYAHHAGLPATAELDYFCAGFTNAYDLTIAGRCHASAPGPESRTNLYDRYVRHNLLHNSAVASALLRTVAAEMAQTFSLFLVRDTFERFAEDFLAGQSASLTILDEIRASRLIRLTDDSFSFEHELLFDYFNAEHLRRASIDANSLSYELRKPRNQDLFELILPRFSATGDIATILPAACDANVLCRVLSGICGLAAQSVLLHQCESLLDRALQDLSSIEIVCETTQVEPGRKRFTTLQARSTHVWTRYDALLCNVIAINIDHPQLQQKFLELFDVTEWTLRTAVHKAAQSAGFKPAAIWAEAVRLFGGVLQFGSLHIPCVSILSAMRTAQMFPRQFKDGLPIRSQLFERIGKIPASHFSMLVLFEDLQHGDIPRDVETNLKLIQRGLDSGIYILRISALGLLQSMARYVDEIAPQHLPPIRQMLESCETNHIMENTLRLEALASYGGLDLPVSLNDALSEMRSLIAPGAADNPELMQLAESLEVSPAHVLAQNARSCLTNIFEDIFQGVYYEAYSELSDEEKHNILYLAATARRGFSTDWIVRELLRYGRRGDLSVLQHLASRPDADKVCPQESVAVFVLGIVGCARFDETPPLYSGGDSAEHVAWKTIGEILFWLWRAKTTGCSDSRHMQTLWRRLTGQAALATADVLYQLVHSRCFGLDNETPDFVTTFPEEIRPILEQCIPNKELLPTVFGYGGGLDRNVIRFLIAALGKIGDDTTIPVLQGIVDDSEFGKDAIQAIELIRRNLILSRDLRLT